jgi:hypothetical protein
MIAGSAFLSNQKDLHEDDINKRSFYDVFDETALHIETVDNRKRIRIDTLQFNDLTDNQRDLDTNEIAYKISEQKFEIGDVATIQERHIPLIHTNKVIEDAAFEKIVVYEFYLPTTTGVWNVDAQDMEYQINLDPLDNTSIIYSIINHSISPPPIATQKYGVTLDPITKKISFIYDETHLYQAAFVTNGTTNAVDIDRHTRYVYELSILVYNNNMARFPYGVEIGHINDSFTSVNTQTLNFQPYDAALLLQNLSLNWTVPTTFFSSALNNPVIQGPYVVPRNAYQGTIEDFINPNNYGVKGFAFAKKVSRSGAYAHPNAPLRQYDYPNGLTFTENYELLKTGITEKITVQRKSDGKWYIFEDTVSTVFTDINGNFITYYKDDLVSPSCNNYGSEYPAWVGIFDLMFLEETRLHFEYDSTNKKARVGLESDLYKDISNYTVDEINAPYGIYWDAWLDLSLLDFTQITRLGANAINPNKGSTQAGQLSYTSYSITPVVDTYYYSDTSHSSLDLSNTKLPIAFPSLTYRDKTALLPSSVNGLVGYSKDTKSIEVCIDNVWKRLALDDAVQSRLTALETAISTAFTILSEPDETYEYKLLWSEYVYATFTTGYMIDAQYWSNVVFKKLLHENLYPNNHTFEVTPLPLHYNFEDNDVNNSLPPFQFSWANEPAWEAYNTQNFLDKTTSLNTTTVQDAFNNELNYRYTKRYILPQNLNTTWGKVLEWKFYYHPANPPESTSGQNANDYFFGHVEIVHQTTSVLQSYVSGYIIADGVVIKDPNPYATNATSTNKTYIIRFNGKFAKSGDWINVRMTNHRVMYTAYCEHSNGIEWVERDLVDDDGTTTIKVQDNDKDLKTTF